MAESSLLEKIEESLECPVCYKIPRDLPIPSCGSGHIVCKSCRSRVTDCPTCRGELGSNTNSLAAKQIMLVDHNCKYSHLQCEVKLKLNEIIKHEKHCSERTVICPSRNCKKEIQIKKFDEHAKEKCARSNGKDYSEVLRRAVLFTLTKPKRFEWDGVSKFKSIKLGFNKNHDWQFVHFYAHDLSFYLCLDFLASKQSFNMYVMVPKDVETASKFTAKITVVHEEPRKLTYEGPVLSMDDLPDMESDQADRKYWVLPYDAAYPFYWCSRNPTIENENIWDIRLKLKVEVLKIGDKKRKLE